MDVPRRIGRPDHCKAIAMGVGKRPQQYGVDQRKDSVYSSDAERQSQEGGDSKARCLRQGASAVSNVLPGSFKPGRQPTARASSRARQTFPSIRAL